jgi:hypothetical protein
VSATVTQTRPTCERFSLDANFDIWSLLIVGFVFFDGRADGNSSAKLRSRRNAGAEASLDGTMIRGVRVR